MVPVQLSNWVSQEGSNRQYVNDWDDGINLIKKDGFSASGLREGDRFVILSSSELENVGEIKNEIFSYDVLDISGKSVKRFYELDASE